MIRIARVDLLTALEAVQPGLSTREIVEQSSCVVFRKGKVIAFNDEVAVTSRSGLPKDFTGAVLAKPLLTVLQKMPEDEVQLLVKEAELIIVGKKRKAGLRFEAEITLPVETVEAPEDTAWKPLSQEFTEAINIVKEGAGKDESEELLTCVHITPKFVETSDTYQITRYKVKTSLEKSILVRRDSIKHITPLDMTEFAVTPTWIHFRNPAKLMLSCRLFAEDSSGFPDLTPYLEVPDGKPATLPKGLVKALEIANEFTSENVDSNLVNLTLKSGKVIVKGVGISGWYREVRKLVYTGPTLNFCISPKQLMEIVTKYNDCVVSKDRLRVSGGRWIYCTVLGTADDKPADQANNSSGDEE